MAAGCCRPRSARSAGVGNATEVSVQRLMRPEAIALAGAAAGFVAALAALWLGHTVSPSDGLTLFVRTEAPRCAAVFFAVHAAIVLLLTTVCLAFDLLRIRERLETPDPYAGFGDRLTGDRWLAVFADTSFAPLAGRILDLAPAAEAPDQGETPPDAPEIVLLDDFDPTRLRREVACRFRHWLVLTQFAAAVALLLIIAGLGLAQSYAAASLAGFVVSPQTPVAALVALAVLTICGRLAIATAAEPLIDAITQLPLPRLATRLFGLVAAFTESAGEPASASPASLLPAAVPAAALDRTLQRFTAALDENREALRAAIAPLSGSAAALSAAARAIADRPGDAGLPAVDAAAIAQLRQAIARLTATIERLPANADSPRPANAMAPPAESAPVPAPPAPPRRRRVARRGDLGSELRRLIEEFE